jgi:hypothetical protein
MVAIDFDSADLVDGEINGWPVSFIATNYGPQGWSLHLAPYSKEEDGEESSAPDELLNMLDRANFKVSDMRKPSKADIRRVLQEIGFTPDA